ncbi:hypothetical protein [Streptomyces sp. 1222.5]|uniref:hypothetical protein n=1 Tax=Streptomyces sp. 1222.5 TaxID=1881026 RepID=UPI003D72C3C2
MNILDPDNEKRPMPLWKGAGMMALGYVIFHTGLTYFIGHPLNLQWILWPAVGTAGITVAADLKGIGDEPWFIRTLMVVIVAVATVGAIKS